MKNRLFFITASFLLLFAVVGNAQIKIGNNPTTIGASSLLELESTTKGIVFPRLTGAQMIAIPSPVAGMQIYNTDSSCVCQYNGTAWRSLCGGNTGSPYLDWHILGNSGTSAATNFIGTIDAIDFVTRTGNTERMRVMAGGNVGIGLPNPLAKFSVLRSAAAVPATTGTATTAIARFEAQNNALDIGAYSAAPYGNWIQSTAASDLSFNGPIALNPNGGYVGVGVAAPGNHLEVMNDGGSGFNERIALKSYTANPNPILVLQTATGTAAAPGDLTFGQNNGAIAFVGQYNGSLNMLSRIGSKYTGDGTKRQSELQISTSGVEHLRIDSMGRIMQAINTAVIPNGALTSYHMYGDGTSGYQLLGTAAYPTPGNGPEIGFARGGFYNGVGAAIQFIDYNAYSGGLAFLVHKGQTNSGGGAFADNWPLDVLQAMTIVNNGQIGIGTADPTAKLHIMAGGAVASGAPLKFTDGTVLTTIEKGAIEKDANVFYATPDATNRGLLPAVSYTINSATVALSNNQSPQSIFTSTQDEINIVASTTYEFEAQYIITGIGGSGKTISTLFALGGGASVTNIAYTATSVTSVAGAATAPLITYINVATATVTTASVSTATAVLQLKGIIRVDAGGTLTPQIKFNNNNPGGSALGQVNSYFKLTPVGTNTVQKIGSWN